MAMEYKIGTSVGTLVTLDTLGFLEPKNTYQENSVITAAANARRYGHGYGVCNWDWGFVSLAARNALRSGYCTGRSGDVVVRTRKDDGTYANFTAVIIWPEKELNNNDRILGFGVVFLLLAVIP
jgi:hypothetical protein